jgi:hypothetical protein
MWGILPFSVSAMVLKYCYHFTYNNWHLFPLHICFHLLHIYAPRAPIINTITFHLIYYMTTFQKKICTWCPSPTPSEGPQNMKFETHLVNTFHLIYYMTTFIKPYCFALDDLAPPPRKGPKIWNPNPTRQELLFDLLHDYLSKTLIVFTWWPCPTPSERPQYMKFTSRHASFCRTSIRWRHTSGHATVTSLHLPVRELLWGCAIAVEPVFFSTTGAIGP